MKYVIVGTAGHIDHGKSALVEALTGTNPDRLEEEKRRGITIDLGFAHLDLGGDVRVGFVDVPGHERFVKNMLAGVGGIDLVLLVIAADESIKPQTREHFDICKLLGIRKGLVALTKSDLVEREILDLVSLEIQDFVAGSFLEGAPIVPVSARTRRGLESLQAELRRLSLEVSPKPADSPFRLPIDRSFVMKGFGAVVTGTLIAGKIRKEAEVEIFPLGRRARVRGIEARNLPVEQAVAGQRTALNLVGTEVRELARGMTLAPPGMFEPTARIDCALSLLPSARPLKNRARVHFHCWTAETVAEVVLLETKELKPGERAFAQLRLAAPGLFLPGDRFIIRQFSPLVTLGGGCVLDNQPQHKMADPRLREFLAVLERGDAEARLEIWTRQAGEMAPSALVARAGWQPSEVFRVGQLLAEKQVLFLLGAPPSLLVHAEYFQAVSKSVVERLLEFHEANPLAPALSKEELRGRTVAWLARSRRAADRGRARSLPGAPARPVRPSSPETALPSAALFNAVLQRLSADGQVGLQGESVRLAGREVQLSAEERAAKEQISRAFEQTGLAAPSVREVLEKLRIDRARAGKILQILLKEKTLVKITEDLVFHRAALTGLREQVAQRKARSDRLNVAAFKEMTGLSRKYAIPLLEYLDRERITRRAGDERIIL